MPCPTGSLAFGARPWIAGRPRGSTRPHYTGTGSLARQRWGWIPRSSFTSVGTPCPGLRLRSSLRMTAPSPIATRRAWFARDSRKAAHMAPAPQWTSSSTSRCTQWRIGERSRSALTPPARSAMSPTGTSSASRVGAGANTPWSLAPTAPHWASTGGRVNSWVPRGSPMPGMTSQPSSTTLWNTTPSF